MTARSKYETFCWNFDVSGIAADQVVGDIIDTQVDEVPYGFDDMDLVIRVGGRLLSGSAVRFAVVTSGAADLGGSKRLLETPAYPIGSATGGWAKGQHYITRLPRYTMAPPRRYLALINAGAGNLTSGRLYAWFADPARTGELVKSATGL